MSDWTLPDDLRRVTVHGDHNVGISVSHFDGPTYLTASDNPDVASVLVTADDLRTIAARLVTIADAIDPPPHDPDAVEWVIVDAASWRSLPGTKAEVTKIAAGLDRTFPHDAPHRVVHISELPMT